jgi:hypothetical protein
LQVTHLNDSISIHIADNDKNKPLNSNFWNVQNLKKAKDVCVSILESKKLDNSVTIIADGAGIWLSALVSQLLSFDNGMDLAFTQTDLIDEMCYQQETNLFKNQFSKARKEIQELKQMCVFKKNKPFIDVIYSCNTPNCSFFFYIDPIAIGQHVNLFSNNPTWQTLLGSKKGVSINLNTVFCNVQPKKEQTVTTSSSYTPTSKEIMAMVYAIGTKMTTLESFFPLKKNIVALWPIDESESIKIIDN